MISNVRKDQVEKIWRVPQAEPLKKFSILTSPDLNFQNKEEWYSERKREILEKRYVENKIF